MPERKFPCCDHCYIGSDNSNGCVDKDVHTVPCNELSLEHGGLCQTEKDEINVVI